jgi:hypothetical protein
MGNPLQSGLQNVQADGAGNLCVNVRVGGGGGGGTVTANQGTAAALAGAWPVEITDGTNVLGTSSHPIRIDPTGTTVQPISGTITLGAGSALIGEVEVTDGTNILFTTAHPGVVSGTIALGAGSALIGEVEVTDGTNVLFTSGHPGFVNVSGNPADNIAQWGGTAVSAPPATTVPATGSEVAPVIKPLQRRNQIVVVSGAYTNGVTVSTAWIDTQATGDSWAAIAGAILTGGGSSSIALQQCNDTGNSNTFQTIQTTALSALNTYFAASGAITNRYWRAQFIGGSVSGTCDFYATAGAIADIVAITGQFAGTGGIFLPVAIGNGQITEGAGVDGIENAGAASSIALAAAQMVWTSGANGGTVFRRTPAVFKTVSVSATASGNTAVWTPTSGKKFRLMRFQITAQGLSATAATILTISFQDVTTGITIGTYDVLLPATANLQPGITQVSGWVDLGNGYLSSAANNVLNANISATVTGATGTFRVNACGTEE